jgi:P27 family predicted phage terminase small subunit
MGKRGPKATPTAIRLAYSRPSKDGGAIEDEVPPVQEAPPPPPWLKGEAAKAWQRLVPQMLQVQLLTNLDLETLAAYCECVRVVIEASTVSWRNRKGSPDGRGFLQKTGVGSVAVSALHQIKMQAMRDMSRYAQTLGLTPSARASIALGEHGGVGGVGDPSQRERVLSAKYGI